MVSFVHKIRPVLPDQVVRLEDNIVTVGYQRGGENVQKATKMRAGGNRDGCCASHWQWRPHCGLKSRIHPSTSA